MVAQKRKKKPCWQKYFAFFNIYQSKTQLIKALHSLHSSRTYERLLENSKTEGSRELFLPENDFKTYTLDFLKKHSDFGGLETNRRYEIQTLIFLHALTHL